MKRPRNQEILRQPEQPPSEQEPQELDQGRSSFSIAQAHYSGPIPPPSMMAQYNEVIPNGADRIRAMAEEQQNHRHSLEKTVIESDAAQSKRGTQTGGLCLVVAYLTSGFLGYTGHDGAAIAIAGTVSVVFGGAYAAGLWSRRTQLQKKENTRQSLRDKK
jgi:uncharacterized membrane protein